MARGGGRKRKKGGGPLASAPPDVRAAAARLKAGRATSADQKLLRAWQKKRKGGGGKERLPDVTDKRYGRTADAVARDAARLGNPKADPDDAMFRVQNRITDLHSDVVNKTYARVDRDAAFGDKLEAFAARRGSNWEDTAGEIAWNRVANRLGSGLAKSHPALASDASFHARLRGWAADGQADLSPEFVEKFIRAMARPRR